MFSFWSQRKDKARREGFREGVLAAEKAWAEKQRAERMAEMGRLIGAPVLVISNEWDNPVIGFAKQVSYPEKGE